MKSLPDTTQTVLHLVGSFKLLRPVCLFDDAPPLTSFLVHYASCRPIDCVVARMHMSGHLRIFLERRNRPLVLFDPVIKPSPRLTDVFPLTVIALESIYHTVGVFFLRLVMPKKRSQISNRLAAHFHSNLAKNLLGLSSLKAQARKEYSTLWKLVLH